jgi:hypothetical protein
MSTATNVLATGSQSITNYDTSKIFIFDNEYETGTVEAGAYDDLLPGTLLGRIAVSGVLVQLDSAATDGSQFPVGILVNTVEAGDSKTSTYCIAGEVDEASVILSSGDTLSTVISTRQLRDRIKADTKGIKLVAATQLSKLDNQ